MQHSLNNVNASSISKTPLRIVVAGACGMGMLPLALLLKQSGAEVFAFDDAINPRVLPYFNQSNIPFSTSTELPQCDVLIHTSAIQSNHPLYQQAMSRGVRICRRGEYFDEFVKGKKLIAVVGSHGKTTTTALLIKILKHVGFDFSYYLGGLFQDADIAPAHYSSTSDWIIAEIDESDGTIQSFSPYCTVLLNLSWDHNSFYHDLGQLQQTFGQLLQRTQSKVFINAEESSVAAVGFSDASKVIACSLKNAPGAVFHAISGEDGSGCIQMELQKGFRQHEIIHTQLYGGFNVSNSLIALSVAAFLSDKTLAHALDNFMGVSRRQEVLYSDSSRAIITDYAHHPNELESFLKFVSQKYANKNIITLFQPHRYSRTRQYAGEFAQILSLMKAVHLMPVYCASEAACDEGMTERIYEKMLSGQSNVTLWKETASLFRYLQAAFTSNTVVLFIGAGDIELLARDFAVWCSRCISSSVKLSA